MSRSRANQDLTLTPDESSFLINAFGEEALKKPKHFLLLWQPNDDLGFSQDLLERVFSLCEKCNWTCSVYYYNSDAKIIKTSFKDFFEENKKYFFDIEKTLRNTQKWKMLSSRVTARIGADSSNAYRSDFLSLAGGCKAHAALPDESLVERIFLIAQDLKPYVNEYLGQDLSVYGESPVKNIMLPNENNVIAKKVSEIILEGKRQGIPEAQLLFFISKMFILAREHSAEESQHLAIENVSTTSYASTSTSEPPLPATTGSFRINLSSHEKSQSDATTSDDGFTSVNSSSVNSSPVNSSPVNSSPVNSSRGSTPSTLRVSTVALRNCSDNDLANFMNSSAISGVNPLARATTPMIRVTTPPSLIMDETGSGRTPKMIKKRSIGEQQKRFMNDDDDDDVDDFELVEVMEAAAVKLLHPTISYSSRLFKLSPHSGRHASHNGVTTESTTSIEKLTASNAEPSSLSDYANDLRQSQ